MCEAQANSPAPSLKLSVCSRPTKDHTLTAKFWNPSASPQATSGRVRIVCISFSASWCSWHTDTLRLPVTWWKIVGRWHRTVHYGEQKVDIDDPAGCNNYTVQVHLLVRGSRKPSLALQTHEDHYEWNHQMKALIMWWCDLFMWSWTLSYRSYWQREAWIWGNTTYIINASPVREMER